MLQISSNNGAVFGPFETIDKLEDRYDCNKGEVHLPFTVVGNDCVIGEWVPPVEPEVIDAPVQP